MQSRSFMTLLFRVRSPLLEWAILCMPLYWKPSILHLLIPHGIMPYLLVTLGIMPCLLVNHRGIWHDGLPPGMMPPGCVCPMPACRHLYKWLIWTLRVTGKLVAPKHTISRELFNFLRIGCWWRHSDPANIRPNQEMWGNVSVLSHLSWLYWSQWP